MIGDSSSIKDLLVCCLTKEPFKPEKISKVKIGTVGQKVFSIHFKVYHNRRRPVLIVDLISSRY